MTHSAAVVGAGIGGLAIANYLVQHGWSVDVFERSASLPATGTALGMWPEALAALDAIGCGDRVRSVGAEQRTGAIKARDGSVIANITSHRGSTYLISRPPLLAALADTLPDGVVTYSSTVSDAAALSGYDVVIGADGVNSRIRTTVAGREVAPRFLGVSALIGWAPGATDSATETWGDGRIFGVTPRDGNRTNWFSAYSEDIDTEPPADTADMLRRKHIGWHRGVTDVLDRLDEESIVHYRVKEMPPLRNYVAGNVVLIGDAAHAMAPNLGRGACETLVDSVALGRALTEHGVTEGLRRYDAQRRKHTQRLVRGANLMCRLAMATRYTGARNSALRFAARFA